MRELEDKSWFSKWEEELPSPDELMPLTKTLITPDLARVFNIRSSLTSNSSPPPPQKVASDHVQAPVPSPRRPGSAEFAESGELGTAPVTGEEAARTLKRPRLVWTPQLHKRFVDAVAQLGIKNAVPKTIMQLMNVDGLTRENVASHLQKYRLYLKRMQGSSGRGGGGVATTAAADPATEHLFASSSVPPHLLRTNADRFLPLVPVPANHHHPQMAAAAVATAHHRSVGHFGSGQFEHPFLSRQVQHQLHRMGPELHGHGPLLPHVEDLDTPSNNSNGGRKVLTLFPTGDD